MSTHQSYRVSRVRPDALVPVRQAYPVVQPVSALPAAFFSLPRSGVLWDLDGTLVESKMIWWYLLNQASIDLGYGPLVFEQWEPTYGQSMEANRDAFFPRHSQREADQYCYDNYGRYIEHLHVLPGAEAALDAALHALGGDASRMAICTNCPAPITQQIVTKCPMLTRFFSAERTFCAGSTYQVPRAALRDPESEARLLHLSDEELRKLTEQESSSSASADAALTDTFPHQIQPKPCADLIHHACGALGMRSDQIVFVGDSRFDLMSSVSAGSFSVGIGAKGVGGHLHVNTIADLAKQFQPQ